ncbi:uncharacterized protein [Henckelia pumila]|uniref:uncharacterized protein isoform X1 n=1 Tax=Henckelia pumila TaxID=405737 RepID=UPI003C6DE099
MIITYYYSLLAYISLSPLIPFFYAHRLFSLIPRAISDSKLTPPISPSSAAHFANTAVADLHRHCRGPPTANREFFFLHYKALESGSLGIAIYEAVEIGSSNIHGFNKFPSVADENIMPLFLEKYHPTIAAHYLPFKIGIWNWHLSVEKNQSIYIRLFPEPSCVSKDQPPIALWFQSKALYFAENRCLLILAPILLPQWVQEH